MSPKSELVSVRVEEDLADELEEAVEKRKQVAGEYDDEPEEPEVLRRVLRLGVEVIQDGDTRLERVQEERDGLRERVARLEAENDRLRQQIENPQTGDLARVVLNAPEGVKTGAAGVLLTFAGTVLLIGISWLSTAFSGSVPWVLVGAALVLSIGGLALVFGSVSVSLMLALSRRVRGEADSSTDDDGR